MSAAPDFLRPQSLYALAVVIWPRALCRVAAAAALLWRLERRLTMDQLVDELRRVRPGRRPDLRTAACEARIVARFVRWLPPWRMGPCMKRSLLLVRLWARHGVAARLCLGSRSRADGGRSGHAWLVVEHSSLEPWAGRPAGDPVAVL